MSLGVNEDEISKMLAYFDPKRTGTIDYNTFCDRVTRTQSSRFEPTESAKEKILAKLCLQIQEKNLGVRQAFLIFNQNRDGTVSTSEFIKTFRNMELGLNEEEISKMLAYFDPKRTEKID